jgi:hypothetical protein
MKQTAVMLVLCFASSMLSHAQDIHFSQFQLAPLQLNPGLCGMYQAEWRQNANFRNQWLTVPVNYNTINLSVEKNLVVFSKSQDRIAAGISMYYDRAGDSRYTTANPALSLSYIKSIGREKHQFISIGVRPALIYRQMDYTKLKFDAQFNGESYDPNAATYEDKGILHHTQFDLGAGIAYQAFIRGGHSVEAGFGVSHIAMGNNSWKQKAVLLQPRYTAHARGTYMLNGASGIMLDLLYQRQQNRQEFVTGLVYKYNFRTRNKDNMTWMVGPYYRWKDAVIIYTGIDINHYMFGFSYDINSSAFQKATGTYGAVELSFIYLYSSVHKNKAIKVICPIF